MRHILRVYREAYAGLPREVWLLALISLINRAGAMVLTFLVLYLTSQRGMSAPEAGVYLALYGAGAIVGVALGGWLTDRIGAFAVQAGSFATSGVLLIVLGSVESPVAIGVVVVFVSLCAEAFRPANSTAVAVFAPAEKRARAFGLQRLAINVGVSIGPAIGGFLAKVDYGLLFLVDGGTSLVAAAAFWVLFRQGIPRGAHGDSATASGRSPWSDRAFLTAMGALLLTSIVFFQLLGTFSLHLRDVEGFDERAIGLTFAINTVLIILFEMPLVRAVERFAPLRVMGFGALAAALGLGLLPFGHGVAWVVFTVVVWTLGEMLIFPIGTTFAANRASDANRGRYMGLFGMTFSVAFVIAPIGTVVYGRWGSEVLWPGALAVGTLSAVAFGVLSIGARKAQGRSEERS